MLLKIFPYLIITFFLQLSSAAQKEPGSLKDSIFEYTEVEACYPGDENSWKKYLQRTLNANVPLDHNAPAGYYTVYVRFIVSSSGSVTDIVPLTKLGYGMEQEVVRIIKKSGDWTPGMHKDQKVSSYHTQPVKFVVMDEGVDIESAVLGKLFVGIDNLIEISVAKLKPEEIDATIENGTITPIGNGKFNVRVTDTTKRALITVLNNTLIRNKEINKNSLEICPQREAPDADKPKQ